MPVDVKGRPPKYSDPEEMIPVMQAYFDECDKGGTIIIKQGNQLKEVHRAYPYTWAGLALALGFKDRHSLWDYCNVNKHKDAKTAEGFSHIISRAKSLIEAQTVNGSMLGKFDSKMSALTLSANHGYTTKTEQEITHKGMVSLEQRLLRAEQEAEGE